MAERGPISALVIDVESTIHAKGNPHSRFNKLCTVALLEEAGPSFLKIEYDEEPYGANLKTIQGKIDQAQYLVGHNIKFDILWLLRYNITIPPEKKIWDTQIAEFILSHQTLVFPSLQECSERYGLGSKIDVIADEYWNMGIDTDQIPLSLLCEYNVQDAILTHKLRLAQTEKMTPEQQRLCWIQGADLLCLTEMQHNGMKFNFEEASRRSKEVKNQIQEIDDQLFALFPYRFLNWASNDHLSAVLYGGKVKERRQEPIGLFKTGDRAGQVRYKWVEVEHEFPRLVEPLREVKKEGYFTTDTESFRTILARRKLDKTGRAAIELILKRSNLEKLGGTYYEGLPGMYEEHGWDDECIHGTFNQCIARTSRLSSSKPNLQNVDDRARELFISRYVN